MEKSKEPSYRLWVTYHDDSQISEYGLKEDATHRLFASHKDAEGVNINHMNPVYSEMVTMYYVWKNNLRSRFVGFEHYRRHLDVKRLPAKGECQVYHINNFLFESVYGQYSRFHNAKDMDMMLKAVDNRYGKGNKYTKNIREGHFLVANCTFLMRWQDFVKMCEFLFPLLDDFSALCGISNTNVEEWRKKAVRDFGANNRIEYQTRILSFLAERLISAWILTELSPYLEGRNVAIVHYNTPKLLEATIRSLMKNSPGSHVYVFDNSDKRPFKKKVPNVEVIDNTKGKYVDFERELAQYPDKDAGDVTKSNYGSAKHAMSVDCLMELIPEGFILMDSDVLVKKGLERFYNDEVACMGMEEKRPGVPISLLTPYLCWLNVPMLRKSGIHYFNGEKMWALTRKAPNCYYDTGAWLLEEVRRHGLRISLCEIWSYVDHLGHGSWMRDENVIDSWLKEHSQLWE